jgi:hypothetical protein
MEHESMKRRDVLKGLAAASLVVTAGRRAAAEGPVEGDHEVEYLLVQNAEGVVLRNGRLTLKGVAPHTLYFSDRPDRIVGRTTTKAYVDHWSVGKNNFASDPPNAVLSILQEPEPQDIVVVLDKPRLEGADLVYDVEVLDGASTAEGGASALFIDVIGRPATPLSVAGAHRRRRRRVRRAIR